MCTRAQTNFVAKATALGARVLPGRTRYSYGKLTYNKLRVTGAYQCIMWMKFAGTKQEITIKYG